MAARSQAALTMARYRRPGRTGSRRTDGRRRRCRPPAAPRVTSASRSGCVLIHRPGPREPKPSPAQPGAHDMPGAAATVRDARRDEQPAPVPVLGGSGEGVDALGAVGEQPPSGARSGASGYGGPPSRLAASPRAAVRMSACRVAFSSTPSRAKAAITADVQAVPSPGSTNTPRRVSSSPRALGAPAACSRDSIGVGAGASAAGGPALSTAPRFPATITPSGGGCR